MDPKIIVAMKGHPCTGKSTVAEFMADELGCIPIKLDDVRSCMTMLQQQQQPLEDAEETVNNISFEIICQTALTQIRSGLSVVLDSPLLHRAHLDRLLELSTSTKLPLVIVECIPRDRAQWKLRLEKQQQQQQEEVVNGGGASCYWYRPSTTWDDLQRRLKTFIDYEVGEGEIRKLVVDTTSLFKKNISHAVYRLSLSKLSHCVDLTQWVRDGFDGLEGEEDWKEDEDGKQEEERRPPDHVHHLTISNEETINNRGVTCCRKCQQEIITGEEGLSPTTYYKCANCDIVLHKSCAETPNKEELEPFHCLPFLDPSSLEYSFPETYSCHFHSDAIADNGGFSYDCPECLFESHLRCAMLPSVLHFHDKLHKGPLFFAIFPARHDMTFYCHACGNEGKDAFYMCNDCPLIMHVNCALLTPTLKYQRHRHTLTLTRPLQVQENSETEYICDTCENGRDPYRWVYECLECSVYTSHLNCVVPVKLNLP